MGEFVAVGAPRQYRRDMKIKLQDLRDFIDDLRPRFGVPYPLADQRPLASGRELVYAAQLESQLPSELWLVTRGGGQLLLTGPAEVRPASSATWAAADRAAVRGEELEAECP